MKKTLLAAAMALLTTAGYAQFVSQTPAGGFDLNSGKDYIPVYMPAPQLSQIQGKILADNNLDPDQVNNSLDFWIDNWMGDKASKVQAYVVPEGTVEKNSWGGTEYIGITPIGYKIAAGVFTAHAKKYDLTRLTDDHILHIGLCDASAKGGMNAPQLTISFGKDANNPDFNLIVNKTGYADGKDIPVGNITRDKKWHAIEIKVGDIKDDNGDIGIPFTWDNNISAFVKLACADNANTILSKATYAPLEPGQEIADVTITELGTALAIESIFFYIPETNAINDIQASAGNDVQTYYDLSGRRVENPANGIYVVKTAKGTKKVVIK